MKIITTTNPNFKAEFEQILSRAKTDIKEVSSIVTTIIDDIIENKNDALKSHIEKFDKWVVKSDEDLQIEPSAMKEAYDKLDDKLRSALHLAYDRIKAYH